MRALAALARRAEGPCAVTGAAPADAGALEAAAASLAALAAAAAPPRFKLNLRPGGFKPGEQRLQRGEFVVAGASLEELTRCLRATHARGDARGQPPQEAPAHAERDASHATASARRWIDAARAAHGKVHPRSGFAAALAAAQAAAAAPAVKRERRAEPGGEVEVIDLTDSPPLERA